MKSQDNSIDRLIEDSSFRNWVLRSNQQDFEKWQNLIERDATLRQVAEEAKTIVLIAELENDLIPEDENRRSLQNLMNVIAPLDRNDEAVTPSDEHAPVMRFSWLRYAAILIVMILAGSGFYFFSMKEQANIVYERKVIKHSTGKGQFLTVQLPDGSKVRLNAGSTIEIAEDYMHDRKVRLLGEGFFEVTKNKENPFEVVTENFTVKVLGTSFDVASYPESNGKVSVKTGTVNVTTNDSKGDFTLVKNNALQFDLKTKQLHQARFNEQEFLWAEGVLVFSGDGIESISQKLENWYGVEITVLHPDKITGQFDATYHRESLESILEGLSYVLHFSFTLDAENKTVIIKPNEP